MDVNALTQDISRLKCFPNCCENAQTLVRHYKDYKNMIQKARLPILAVSGEGPSPSSKSIRTRSSPFESVQSTPQSSSLDELSGLARLAHVDPCRKIAGVRRRSRQLGGDVLSSDVEMSCVPRGTAGGGRGCPRPSSC